MQMLHGQQKKRDTHKQTHKERYINMDKDITYTRSGT